MTNTTHLGKKIERIREIVGMKQDTLASKIGVSQQAVSKMEQSATIDDEKLEEVAKALGIPSEAIKRFNDEAIFNIIANNFHDSSANYMASTIFNPIEKIVELYERLLTTEREKVELLQQQLKK